MKTRILVSLVLVISSVCCGYELDATVKASTLAALKNGTDYLVKTQNPDGSWGEHFKHPAVAALCVMALDVRSGSDPAKARAAVENGIKYVSSFIQPDGSIFPADRDKGESANYPNYTTSLALLMFATLDRPQDRETMRKARNYLISAQFGDANTADFGGIGYGRTGRADLSNLSWAAEALYYSEFLESEPYTTNPDPKLKKQSGKMWADTIEFISKCQNLQASNKEAKLNDGGMFYRPGESKAETPEQSGLVSSGSMTYAGLKSMIYAKLDRSDPRVKGALNYLMSHYTLKENPGMGMQGLYFYLHSMIKALDAYNQDIIEETNGTKHDWRKEVLVELNTLQRKDGSWANEHGRFFESVPHLATPYAMIAMKIAVGQNPLKK